MKNLNNTFILIILLGIFLNKKVYGNEWLAVRPSSSVYIPTLPFPNSVFKYKFRGNQTNGLFLLFEGEYLNEGIDHHLHTREDELFHIIEGNVQFSIDGKQFCGKNGDYVYVPRNISQAIRIENKNNNTKPVKLQILLTPAGLEGFLDEVASLYYIDQKNFTRIEEISIKYGIINLDPIQWEDLGCFNQTNSANRLMSAVFLVFCLLKIFF